MTILPTTTFGLGRKLALAGRCGLLAAGLSLLGTAAAQAQALNYTPANAQNVAGTFTDISATGTAIATANTDDANSAALPLGFTFSFNGSTFTQFVFNTNGLIRLGAAPPSQTNIFYTQDFSTTNTSVEPLSSTDPADVNLIMPFNIDLGPGTGAGGAQYRYATTGAAGSRMITIQWKNVSDKAGTGTDMAATQYANFSFQVKLFEGSNNIEFVYGTATAGTGTATARFPNVGIKGSSETASVLANKTSSSAAWSTTVFINGPYGTSTHNFRANVGPDLGRTYRFRPTLSTSIDAAVKVIYTLGQISQAYASPHTVRAVVTNFGGSALTNLPVTLTVTGANTFTNTQTVASLAAGATTTVTFAPYPLTATGTNTVTVTANAPGDTTPANDAASSSQVVANSLEYTDPAATAVFVGGLGSTAANSILLVKYTVTAPTSVTAITPTFTAAAPGSTDTYQVQVYSATGTGAPGTVLYTSPARPRPAAAGADVVSITPTAVNGIFYVATKQLSAVNIGLAYQSEDPLRASTFFFSPDGVAFTDLSTSTFPARLAIQATLSTPTAPTCNPVTALTVSNTTSTTASVSFTPGTGNTSYTVTYTPAGGTPTTVTPAPTASPVALSGLTPNTTYTVSVTPICAGGGTAAATTNTFTTTPAAPSCNPVTGLTVSGTTNTTANVSFTPGTGNTSYTVTYAPAGGPATTVTPNPTASPVALTGLVANTTYTVSVTPICAGGGTAAAATTTFTTTNTAPTCNPVTTLLVGNITNTTASVSFTPGTGNTSYTVTYTPAGGTPTTVTPAPTSSPVSLTNLTPNTTYAVSVTPVCAAGGTAAATTTTFTTTNTTATCNPVTNLAVGNITTTSAGVSFTPGTGNTSYTVTYTPAGGATTTVTPAPTGSPVLLSGLTPSTSYTVVVAPVCGGGGTAGTTTITFATMTATCGAVTNLAVGTISATSASVSFTPGAGNTSYTVTYTPAGGATSTVTPTPISSPVTLTGLVPNTNYTISVTSNCAGGGTAPAATTTVFRTMLGARSALAGGAVSVFPNPAHQSFTVAIPAVGAARSARVEIINNLGQVVRTQGVALNGATQVVIDAANLAAGLYTVRVQAAGETATLRLAIR